MIIMFKTRSALMALALLLCAAMASANTVGIASGQTSGTNYPMAEDIKRVCSTPTSPIVNVVSDGSLDNIMKISGSPDTQYGIIQTDALAFQSGRDPVMMKKIVMVFPFFSTEFHLVAGANSKINSLQDLAGKKVVEGPEGSGTWVTVQLIKSLTGIQWTPILASQTAGTDMVKNGSADAEFLIAGRPVSVLTSAGASLKLVPMNHPALDSYKLYTKTMIPTGSYPGQKVAVSTYKVDNVLATFNYKSQYQKEIGDLVGCIAHNIGNLQKAGGGHPKWKDVDPTDIDRIQWPSHPSAVAAIKRELKASK
jgi:TRAP transporter TAXI family solute receptor